MADPIEPTGERLSRRDPGAIGVGQGPLGVDPAQAQVADAAEKAKLTGKVETGKGGKGGKDDGRKCPPGYHWNSHRKECVKNQGKNDDEGGGKDCPPGFHKNAEGKCVKNRGDGGGDAGDKATFMAGRGPTATSGAPVIPPIGGGGTSGGGGGGSSSGGGGSSGGSSGSSGGSSSTPANPDEPLITAGIRLYFSLWGQVPPTGYIEKLVKSGMNLFEIELHEREKPAFRKTKTYRDEASSYINYLTQNQIVGFS